MSNPKEKAKKQLLAALKAMPEEAFLWLVLAIPESAMFGGARIQIWPDGIGGFIKDSKDTILAARKAAEAYIKACETPENLHPYQSTRDIDGLTTDREQIQDIAYDGETDERKPRRKPKTPSKVNKVV